MTVLYRETETTDPRFRRATTFCGDPGTVRVTFFEFEITPEQALKEHQEAFRECVCTDARRVPDEEFYAAMEASRKARP